MYNDLIYILVLYSLKYIFQVSKGKVIYCVAGYYATQDMEDEAAKLINF